jgi:hypothetical protein
MFLVVSVHSWLLGLITLGLTLWWKYVVEEFDSPIVTWKEKETGEQKTDRIKGVAT